MAHEFGQPEAGRPHIPGYGVSDDAGLLPWSWAEARLTGSHTYWLSTVRPDGGPHVMPVWGVWLNGRFYFSTGPETRKAKNLASEPRSVVSAGKGGDDEAVILEGRAAIETDSTLLAEAARVYNAKYEWSLQVRNGGVYDNDGNGGPMFVVTPDVVFGFGEDFGAATRWRFETSADE